MEQIELTLETRKVTGSGRIARMRKSGIIPAVIYGEGEAPVSVQLPRKDFEHILRHYESTSAIYHLSIMEGGKKQKDVTALLKATQNNPVSDMVSHLDFLRISMDKEITLKVPVILKGEAIGLKKEGSTLEHMLRELEIVCLPKDIPAHLVVDVTNVDTHVSVHVSDLKLPQGVRTKIDPAATIVSLVFSNSGVAAGTAEEAAAKPDLEVTKEKPKDAAAAPAAGAKAAPAAKPEAKK